MLAPGGSVPDLDVVVDARHHDLALQTGVPVLYGIVTADTLEQAIDRAGVKAGNKGFEAAMSAVEMVNLLQDVNREP